MLDITALKTTQAPDLLDLAEQLTNLKKSSSSAGGEWSGRCPFCGHLPGGADKNGFSVQPYHTPEPRWLCRKCTDGKWQDVIDFIERRDNLDFMGAVKALFGQDVKLAPDEVERLRKERAERIALQQQEERDETERRRDELNRSGAWLEYWKNLDRYDMRDLWRKRGLADLWQDYFKVGFCPERTFGYDEQFFKSPTLTIPTFHPVMDQENPEGRELSWKCAQLIHRLLLPEPPGGKYRPHLAGCGKPLFRADIFAPIHGDVLLVEGEIKAAVAWAHIQDYVYAHHYGPGILGRFQVVGTAGQGFKPESAVELTGAERIWICLDPDASEAAGRVGKLLGPKRCRIIQLPSKIDDMLIDGRLDAGDLPGLMNTAKGVL
jgi:hypothetical protein